MMATQTDYDFWETTPPAEAEALDAGRYAAEIEYMTLCPKCGGDPDYENYIPAVTVGEPQPGEYARCALCDGTGYVTQAEADRWQAQTARDNAPPADCPRRTARSLFK